MTFRRFNAVFGHGKGVVVTTYTALDGKLEQFLVRRRSKR